MILYLQPVFFHLGCRFLSRSQFKRTFTLSPAPSLWLGEVSRRAIAVEIIVRDFRTQVSRVGVLMALISSVEHVDFLTADES